MRLIGRKRTCFAHSYQLATGAITGVHASYFLGKHNLRRDLMTVYCGTRD